MREKIKCCSSNQFVTCKTNSLNKNTRKTLREIRQQKRQHQKWKCYLQYLVMALREKNLTFHHTFRQCVFPHLLKKKKLSKLNKKINTHR